MDSLRDREEGPGEQQEPLIVSRDGYDLCVQWWGDPEGAPVFLLHGTPGSRLGPRPRASVLYRLGIRLICYDRPGYGGSTRHVGRTVAHAGGDAIAIADALDIKRFSVVGRSGGGPHALACAAHPEGRERVDRAAVLVSVAPSDAEGLDWFSGMGESNTAEYSGVDEDLVGFVARHLAFAETVSKDPDTLLRALMPELTAADLRVVEDLAIRHLLTETYREALRHGGDGWLDDALAFRKPWGFDVGDVCCDVKFWHGADDRFSPVDHTLWLADELRRTRPDKDTVQVEVAEGIAHFGAVEILPEILGWLAADVLV